jgi:predicted  nucleic acid-binding Zn-ribbon protein
MTNVDAALANLNRELAVLEARDKELADEIDQYVRRIKELDAAATENETRLKAVRAAIADLAGTSA